ncbi:MAG: phosphoribosylaminoimidazolesuccinocarboxamide synthase [Gammaproteobacteria bacterium]|nr:phosphoribosylaminoimidazolesuccinocarboxamide synthase [Gammaproteobacteria bacterium]
MASNTALMTTDLPLPNRRQGKVRDLYDIALPDGSPGVLIVATDRISAFDVVMSNGVPGKGVLLTQISCFWFEHFADRITHHLVSTDPALIAGLSPEQQRMLAGRSMLCRKLDVVPIECVARGYLAGSGWKDYQATGMVCGVALPPGLRNGDQLPEPIFTPATKAVTGHDENIPFAEAAARVGEGLMNRLRDLTLELYGAARRYAAERGILLADTKFEFGLAPGADEPVLVDEIFTPDSSRFWPADSWRPGAAQASFDKQYVRNYLEQLVAAGTWNKSPPGPLLPEEVIRNTLARYQEAHDRLTGPPCS